MVAQANSRQLRKEPRTPAHARRHDPYRGRTVLALAIALTLTTWPHNERAIHVYEKLGFRRVGVTHLSERGADGTWHDELLMELVVEPRPG